jgi:hypothetical protein
MGTVHVVRLIKLILHCFKVYNVYPLFDHMVSLNRIGKEKVLGWFRLYPLVVFETGCLILYLHLRPVPNDIREIDHCNCAPHFPIHLFNPIQLSLNYFDWVFSDPAIWLDLKCSSFSYYVESDCLFLGRIFIQSETDNLLDYVIG